MALNSRHAALAAFVALFLSGPAAGGREGTRHGRRNDRRHRTSRSLEGPVRDLSLGASWVATPTLRMNASVGYATERPERVRNRFESRRFTLFGFSPKLTVTNEARSTNAQALDCRRTRAEVSFVRQF